MERTYYLNYKKNNIIIIIGWLKILFGNIFIDILFIELCISAVKYKLNK